MPPFHGIESEDRVNCHVCDRRSMSVPRIEPCPGDDVRQPGGLLGAAQRRDRHVAQELEAAEQIICFITARVQRRSRDRQCRNDQELATGTVLLNEFLRVRLEDLRPAERRVFIAEGKGGRQRLIPALIGSSWSSRARAAGSRCRPRAPMWS